MGGIASAILARRETLILAATTSESDHMFLMYRPFARTERYNVETGGAKIDGLFPTEWATEPFVSDSQQIIVLTTPARAGSWF